MVPPDTTITRPNPTAPPDPDDGLGRPTEAPPGSLRERIRAKPGTYKIVCTIHAPGMKMTVKVS